MYRLPAWYRTAASQADHMLVVPRTPSSIRVGYIRRHIITRGRNERPIKYKQSWINL